MLVTSRFVHALFPDDRHICVNCPVVDDFLPAETCLVEETAGLISFFSNCNNFEGMMNEIVPLALPCDKTQDSLDAFHQGPLQIVSTPPTASRGPQLPLPKFPGCYGMLWSWVRSGGQVEWPVQCAQLRSSYKHSTFMDSMVMRSGKSNYAKIK